MGTSVQVTPLCGVYNENPLSYLVSIDSFNFLIDCGWNDHFDPTLLQPLSKYHTISLLILSLSKKPHLLILLLQGSVDDRRGTGVASRHASPRRASLCHEAARTQRSGLRHRAGLQIRSSHHVRAVSLTKGEPFFFFFFFQNSIFFEYCVLL